MLTAESALRKDITTGQDVRLEHRHFAFIAATIKNINPNQMVSTRVGYIEARRAMALHFVDACAATNPKFDRARFLAACGVDENQ